MSNQIVGELYAAIIDKIIRESQEDFQNHAYSDEMLMELKNKWQQNLSKMKVAHMPWDPVPVSSTASNASVAGSSNSANVASQSLQQQAMSNQASKLAAMKSESNVKMEPVIKQEPKHENNGVDGRYTAPYAGSAGRNPQAADRASALLQQRFGAQANASIQAAGLPTQPRPLCLPDQQQRISQTSSTNGLANSQMDGAIDWESILSQSRDDAKRPALDRILESTVQENDTTASQEPQTITFSPLSTAISKVTKIPRLDGNLDDDEDAINSDLDDDDEEDAQNIADDGQQGEMILCLWDKVNRVKSKWKCTLKDGILSTGGKEYLFQKATGEFEW